jgi:hypothetical protein
MDSDANSDNDYNYFTRHGVRVVRNSDFSGDSTYFLNINLKLLDT